MIETLKERNNRDWARHDLGRYKDAQREIEHYIEALDKLKTRAQRLSRPLDPNKVQVQSSNNGPEELFCIISDMQHELRPKQLKAEQVCMEIANKVGMMENNMHQRILRDYYLFGQKLRDIAIMEGYCYSRIKDHHREALEAYGEKFGPHRP